MGDSCITNLAKTVNDMTNEQKQLLLKDLCARLPYGVKLKGTTRRFDDTCEEEYVDVIVEGVLTDVHSYKTIEVTVGLMNECEIDTVKPYLRPMSSMDGEEKEEYINTFLTMWDAVDWLNSHHFDYRGLIEKGLALEAPEDMYKEDEK